jgi:hypothetical protein
MATFTLYIFSAQILLSEAIATVNRFFFERESDSQYYSGASGR